jgi:hypothetical protein
MIDSKTGVSTLVFVLYRGKTLQIEGNIWYNKFNLKFCFSNVLDNKDDAYVD